MNIDGLLLNTAIINNLKVTNSNVSILGKGFAPIGTIIALSDKATISSGVDDGWMLCDGSVVPTGNIMQGLNVPQLTDDRFLRGYVSTGSSGGNSSVGITVTNMPNHTHSSSGWSFSGGSHVHTMSNNVGAAPSHTHILVNGNTALGACGGDAGSLAVWYASGSYGHPTIGAYNLSYGSKAVASYNHGTKTEGDFVAANYSTSYSCVSEASHTHSIGYNLGSSGSSTSISVNPLHITTRFIIRVN